MKESPRHIEEELYKRILLTHRFGLSLTNTTYKGTVYSLEELPFDIALQELKRSFSEFMTTRENIEKLLNIFRYTFIHKLTKFSIKDSHIILHNITALILEFYNADYISNLSQTLAQNKILIVPLKTVFSLEDADKNNFISEKIKAIVFFEDRLIKINILGGFKMPGIKIYRTKSYDKKEIQVIIENYLHSFVKPIDAESWDKDLNQLTEAEKIHHITKKEQSVGNGSWLCCKLIIFAAVFSTVFKFCKDQGLRDLEIDPIALAVAESWYKLFIVDDRNRAVSDYLEHHDFADNINGNFTVAGRIQSIKNFLKNPKSSTVPIDKEILIEISIKSLNWLLADYLKKGDIGAAHALIEEEAGNKLWNPLFYAAKNGKNAIAEMLASNAHYMTDKEPNGNTPLHCAAARGNFEMCKIFLKYKNKNKIHIEAQNNEGNTALHEAIKHNRLDIIELLIKTSPALLAIANFQHSSPLKMACDLAKVEALQLLLGYGAKIENTQIENYPENIQRVLRNPPKLIGPGTHFQM